MPAGEITAPGWLDWLQPEVRRHTWTDEMDQSDAGPLLSRLVLCRAPATVRQWLRKCGQVRSLNLLDLETGVREQRWNVSCQVQAAEHPAHQWF